MNVHELRLVNFKRFDDLTIDLSPPERPPRLVLLIGANGTGKSSVFDAFEYLSSPHKGTYGTDTPYVKKDVLKETVVTCVLGGGFRATRTDSSFETVPPGWNTKPAFYGRSSFRTIPQLQASQRGADVVEDTDRPARYIDHDVRFETDISQVTRRILEEVWGPKFDADALKAKFIDPINDALSRIFANGGTTSLSLTQLYPALEDKPPEIRFRKGLFEVPYDYLSSGEKEVFNILLNLFVRRSHFPNAIYFIDEMDVHLHTRLQYALIEEIVENWIPECSQLWTASHSLGFIDYANESPNAAIVDFDDLDFDQRQVLNPSPKSVGIFDIAVPRDSALKVFPNQKLVLCENADASIYNAVGLTGHLFVAERDKNSVSIKTRANREFLGLMDRDFLGSNEIAEIRRLWPNLLVLEYYSLENYLYHPDNLNEISRPDFNVVEYRRLIGEAMRSSRDLMLVRLEGNRNSYEVIKTFSRAMKASAVEEISAATASGDFETFYPFLDMKHNRPGSYLGPFNFHPTELAKTSWFRDSIAKLLEPAG